MREFIPFNRIPFRSTDDVLNDLRAFLPSWELSHFDDGRSPQVEVITTTSRTSTNEFNFAVKLKNEGPLTISDYRIELFFPNPFLNQSTHYSAEFAERSTTDHKFLHATNHERGGRPLLSGFESWTLSVPFFLNDSNNTPASLNAEILITVFSGDLVLKKVKKTIRDVIT